MVYKEEEEDKVVDNKVEEKKTKVKKEVKSTEDKRGRVIINKSFTRRVDREKEIK